MVLQSSYKIISIDEYYRKKSKIICLIKTFPLTDQKDYAIIFKNLDSIVKEYHNMVIEDQRRPTTMTAVKLGQIEKKFDEYIEELNSHLVVSKLSASYQQ